MPELEPTRLSLHAVAELLMAGPQKDVSDTVRLRVVPGGFATIAEPARSIVGVALVAGAKEIALDGRTLGEVAQNLGTAPRPLGDVYTDVTTLDVEDMLVVTAGAARVLSEAWRIGDEALAAFAPAAERVLWPEHFDVAIAVDEVTYGVSPGDHFTGVPYAYVGPWQREGLTGDFWNQPFGASAALTDLGDADAVAAFFARGRELLNAEGRGA
jgi:hypothetical protein